MGGGVGDSVVISPGASDNVAAVIVSGVYRGFAAVVEGSTDGVSYTPLTGIYEPNYLPAGNAIIDPAENANETWLYNITAGQFSKIRVRPISFGNGPVSIGMTTGVIAGGFPTILPGAKTDATQAGTAAATQIVLTMPAVVGKTNYVERVAIDGNGATASLLTIATLAGGYQGSLKFPFFVPAGVNTPLGVFAVDITFKDSNGQFNPIPASQPDLAVTLTVPSFGTGNTLARARLQGYAQ